MKNLLLCLLLTFSGLLSLAQNKDMLAKIAYEDAETAFAAGKVDAALAELKKVDDFLGILTPKSQYLRLQVWSLAVEQNLANSEKALLEGKRYFEMAETMELPEEKLMEASRMMVKFEKDKIAHDKQRSADLESLKKIMDFKDRLFDDFKFKTGLTEAEFLAYNPGSVAGLDRADNGNSLITYSRRKVPKVSYPGSLTFNKGIVHGYTYCIVGDKATADSIRGIFDKYRLDGKSSHPARLTELDDVNHISFRYNHDQMVYAYSFLFIAPSYYNKYPMIHISMSAASI